MIVRFAAAFGTLWLAVAATNAQAPPDPTTSPKPIIACEELIKIREDRGRWTQVSQTQGLTHNGMAVIPRMLAIADKDDNLVQTTEKRTLEAEAEPGYYIGAFMVGRSIRDPLASPAPVRYYTRWMSSKLTAFQTQEQCSNEETFLVHANREKRNGLTLVTPRSLDDTYTLIAYDDRKTILFTAEFKVRPRPARTPTPANPESKPQQADAENDADALRAAYQASLTLDRCSDYRMADSSRAEVQNRLARIEKSARAMNLDLSSVRELAKREAKSALEIFEMIGLMGSLNYEQRKSLQQFCSLQGMELFAASKHFSELDRAAGR